MGLSITAYKNLKAFPCRYDVDTDEVFNSETNELVGWSDYFKPCLNQEFLDRAADINDDQYYIFDDSLYFRAGSYSGYNVWREHLAELAGYQAINEDDNHSYSRGAWNAVSGAFWELINFSDCEGVIGTEVSKKLLKDFIEFDEKAKSVSEVFYELFTEWKTAFQYSSENGAVDFH